MWILIIVLALVFIGWSVVTQMKNTNTTEPLWKRVWASVVAAGMVLVGAVGHWLSSHGTAPGP